MLPTDENYAKYVAILKEELIPAMGCTEPIAVAYCAAVARDTLGKLPEAVSIEASGNIIKNVKSVVVPNTGHLRGIPAAAAAGIIAGDKDAQLEVIAKVSEAEQVQIRDFVQNAKIDVALADSGIVFDIVITETAGDDTVTVRIANFHTNIVHIEKNGEVLLDVPVETDTDKGLTDRSCLSIEGILDFANTCNVEDIKDVLDTQISYNMAIAEEGLLNDYGANVGSVLLTSNPEVLSTNSNSAIRLKARAMAAAGSDARMNGCELPVVINSGSGNQGITASVPVIVYARALKVGEEKLYRALALSNLIAIHLKTPIGRLSAYCGVISAGAAAGAALAYLKDGSRDAIAHTLVNALAIASGVICDGAKASCAAKIALGVDNGILGYEMWCQDQQFVDGDGIVKKGVENTIACVGRLGREGMKETDKEILSIMIDKWVNE